MFVQLVWANRTEVGIIGLVALGAGGFYFVP